MSRGFRRLSVYVVCAWYDRRNRWCMIKPIKGLTYWALLSMSAAQLILYCGLFECG